MLGTYPSMGRTGRVASTRELALPGTAYLIIYRQNGDGIEILRVLHGARDWP
jgi:plasmid stabilization system protein ParE